jgi:hypothetical protein
MMTTGTPESRSSSTVRGKLDWQQVIFRSIDTIVQGCSIAQQYKGYQGFTEAFISGAQIIDVLMVPYRGVPEYKEERERIVFAKRKSDLSPEYKDRPEDGPLDELTRAKKLMEAALAAAALKGVLGIENIVNAEE